MAVAEFTPYVDGWYGATAEKAITVVPNPKFPFENGQTPDVYTRQYDWVYQTVASGYLPKTSTRTACTNLLTYSEAFDNAAWTKVALTVTADAATAPDGQTTFDKLLETAANSEHSGAQAATVTAVAHEAFVFGRAGLGRNFIRIAFTDSAATVFSGFFDVAVGVVGTLAANTTGEVVSLGNGDFYGVIRFTPAAGAGTFKVNVSTNGATISYAGDTAKGMYLWGAQVAAGTRIPYVSTTTVARAVSAPNRDPKDPMAYLATEEVPKLLNSSIAIINRLFSRIPLPQVEISSIPINKPAFPTNDFETFWIDSTAANTTANIWSPTLACTPGSAYVSGGTFTITYKANTTGALNLGDSNVTIAAAVNALASVIADSFTVSSANVLSSVGTLTLSKASGAGNFSNSDFTLNGGSLTPTAVTAGTSVGSNAAILYAARANINLNRTAHGLTNGASVRWNTTTTGGGTLATITYVDANNFTVPNSSATNPIQPTYYRTFVRTYTPGADRMRTQETTTYYLPGVTVGVATAADVPVPAIAITDEAFLELIATLSTGFQPYDADAPVPYLGAFISQRAIAIDIDDA